MQEIIVMIIGLVVIVIIGWKIYKMFAGDSRQNSKCAGCDIDCALRDIPSGSLKGGVGKKS